MGYAYLVLCRLNSLPVIQKAGCCSAAVGHLAWRLGMLLILLFCFCQRIPTEPGPGSFEQGRFFFSCSSLRTCSVSEPCFTARTNTVDASCMHRMTSSSSPSAFATTLSRREYSTIAPTQPMVGVEVPQGYVSVSPRPHRYPKGLISRWSRQSSCVPVRGRALPWWLAR
ncbi:uncharacterized protein K452DRAFT_73091 [Aplosporella prunicola CBS 121167]|uniref:Uncharacterized protein n=1 Tax=Aplosporella prunicola CBS 121167 TaxID=1176127 RepID=A0A6A6BSA5_9PEZI|nr:uncharacterized protein K452DRAFT_73091 [Aplosporella prunicola CBS 121167]KAF2146956.1 hypothetical protein K452DRAFT_73091 [Aplosporella prunicola CBS 121167]